MSGDNTVAKSTLLWNGLRGRCPLCGSRHIFRRAKICRECPRCGFVFERIEGHWIGSLGLNVVVSFTTLVAVLTVAFVLTYPKVQRWEVFAVSVGAAIVVPALFGPISKTLWTAIDLVMRPPEPGEWDPEAVR